MCALLHHIPQLASQGKTFFARHFGCFKEHDVATRGGPGEANRNTSHFGALDNFFAINFTLAQVDYHISQINYSLFASAASSDSCGQFATNFANATFQITHTGFTCIALDHLVQRRFGKLNFLAAQPVLLDLARDQIALGNLDLFRIGITAQINDFHAVAQWWRNCVQHVGRGDKHGLAQIEGHVQIVITKLTILLGIEHF